MLKPKHIFWYIYAHVDLKFRYLNKKYGPDIYDCKIFSMWITYTKFYIIWIYFKKSSNTAAKIICKMVGALLVICECQR